MGLAAVIPTPSGDPWARVAGARPALRHHVEIHRHLYRGRPWYVLFDPLRGHAYRIEARARPFVTALDGRHTLEEIHGPMAGTLTREEALELLSGLNAAQLIQFDETDPAMSILGTPSKTPGVGWRQWLVNPLAVRIPLFDPDRLLSRGLPWVRFLFTRASLLAWVLLVAVAGVLALAHAGELARYGAVRIGDPSNLLLLALTYPLVKGLHELGHGFAVRRWGGEVHEMGVMLLVLIPLPYVDASSASTFADKRRRMVVDAAGILIETTLASLALPLWLAVQPGVVRDLAFNVLLIGGVSTLLFNGNPLLRYDGYYLLSDAMESPNLASRSRRYLGYLARRYLFGAESARPPLLVPEERAWFVAYGIASSAYQVFISLAIALYIAGKYFLIGVLLAVWVVALRILFPSARFLRNLARESALVGHRRRAGLILGGGAMAMLILVLGVPVPSHTRAQGIVRAPDAALVKAREEGFVTRLDRRDGEPVEGGAVLVQLENRELETRRKVLEGRLKEVLARRAAVVRRDKVQAAVYGERLQEIDRQLNEVRERLSQLTVVSPVAGRLVLPRAVDLPGRFLHKGDILGFVEEGGPRTARVVVPQATLARVRKETLRVVLRVAGHPGETLPGRVIGELPSGTDRLPSRILGTPAGGPIPVDTRDPRGVQALGRVFQFDVVLPEEAQPPPGSRVFVRFEHSPETLAELGLRQLRQLFLARFGV